MVFYQSALFGNWSLTMLVFTGGKPENANSPGLCGSFGYALDGPIQAQAPTGQKAPAAAPPAADDTGKWRISRETNVIDDSATFFMALEADSGSSSFGKPISLVARCKSKTTELYVIWNDYLGNDGSIGSEFKWVTVRLGEQKAKAGQWSISTNGQATFAPGWAGDLLREMVKVDRLVVQTTPYNENPVTAVFDIRGMRTPLEELAKTCDWKL